MDKPLNTNLSAEDVQKILQQVTDPEIPVLTIADIGILRGVELTEKGGKPWFNILITPTYSGCPANDVIATSVRMTMLEHGITNFTVITQLSPAWSTDWMTAAAHDKLRSYGIAPPQRDMPVTCPQCLSKEVELISEFGSTACKSLYKCLDCLEPFEVFKCH